MDDTQVRERVARVDALLEVLEGLPDGDARRLALEVVEALLDLYGEGFARVVEHVAERDDGALARAFAGDELVSHLLLLHGLHPVPVEQRVQGALDEVRPYLDSHGGAVELLGVQDGVARLRLEGSCDGCPSSAVTLKLAIEDAIAKAAPDLDGVEAEGAVAPAPPAPGLVDLPMAGAGPALPMAQEPVPRRPQPAWAIAGGVPELAEDAAQVRDVAGEPVLFARRDGSVYAYRPGCPACGGSLDGGALAAGELSCPQCGHRYDVRLAGRGLDDPELHLDPVPLLVDEAGAIKVALGAPA